MSSSWRETRSEATSRVTAAVAMWYWRQGCRVIAREVGLNGRLLRPWSARWRVDLVACDRGQTHVIEVKGTRADLVREDLESGKWTYSHPGLCLWLAIDQSMSLHQNLHRSWGIIRVRDHRVRVERRPEPLGDDTNYQQSLDVVASCLCMQSLPTLMGLTHAGHASVLETEGFDRPWRKWTECPAPPIEEFGNIL